MNTTAEFAIQITSGTGRTVAAFPREQFPDAYAMPSDASIKAWVELVDAALTSNAFARVGEVSVTTETVWCHVQSTA